MLTHALKRFAEKAVEELPAVVGSVASVIFSYLRKAIGFVTGWI